MRKNISISIIFILVLLIYSWTISASAQSPVSNPVPDTGQILCYNNYGYYDISFDSCPNDPNKPFYGQDSQYNINPQSYTKLDVSGDELPFSVTSWSMVRDNVTGLIWEVKTDDESIHDRDNQYNWDDAQSMFIAELNAINFGDYSDWRMPSIKELKYIVDSGRYNPSINTDYFQNTVSSSLFLSYWSSATTETINSDKAFKFRFGTGKSLEDFKTANNYVRAVRGGQHELINNFVINNNDTVTDTSTGLMWQQTTGTLSKAVMTWEEALSFCENLSLGGYDDWRLPNKNELLSIMDFSTKPAINTTAFPDALSLNVFSSSNYWSSTTRKIIRAGDSQTLAWDAWNIDFYYGFDDCDSKSDYYYVRAVRGGQSNLIENISRPIISIFPLDYDFGDVSTDTTSSQKAIITISNIGNKDLSISDIILSDTKNFSLELYGNDDIIRSTDTTFALGRSGRFIISFTPISTGSFELIVTITSNDPNNPNSTVTLLGKGVERLGDTTQKEDTDDIEEISNAEREEDIGDNEDILDSGDGGGGGGCFIYILR